jgi:hypothetical protein
VVPVDRSIGPATVGHALFNQSVKIVRVVIQFTRVTSVRDNHAVKRVPVAIGIRERFAIWVPDAGTRLIVRISLAGRLCRKILQVGITRGKARRILG